MNRALRPPAKILDFRPPDRDALHADVLALAELIQRGEITGLSYTAIKPDGTTVEGVLGRARKDSPRAYWGAMRLARAIMAMG